MRQDLSQQNALARLLESEIQALCREPDGRFAITSERPRILLPGSFNPLHEAHQRLLLLAAERVGSPAAFELSVTNVDKPALTEDTVRLRLEQFAWRYSVWVTRAPTFVEKATLFPGATFAIGADTAERLMASRYYDGREERRLAALDAIRAQGCRFLVAGRKGSDGRFVSMADVGIPSSHRDLFSEIPRSVFDHYISSTQLRRDPSFDRIA